MEEPNEVVTIHHPNAEFIAFVKKLAPVVRSKLKEKLQEAIIGHNQIQFKNWMNERSKIPPYLYSVVNKTAKAVVKEHMVSLLPQLDEEDLLINLFKRETMPEKTSIFLERAKKRWSQKQLAEEAGLSEVTIFNVERIGKTGKGVLFSTAKRIAKAFDRSIDDFEEFAQL